MRKLVLLVLGAMCLLWVNATSSDEEQSLQNILNWSDNFNPYAVPECRRCHVNCIPKCGTRKFKPCCYYYMSKKKRGGPSHTISLNRGHLDFLDQN
ncbi:unnamed protein product [Allacma fusca]|uniref:Uncharacterized protein n=1 Tax=Allacma fusca TaxID=39272 RepID=A0A8J2KKG7_9HEXA|nr:unnamed protein product [Allacma fusca]